MPDELTQYAVLQPVFEILRDKAMEIIQAEPDVAKRSAQYEFLNKLNKEFLVPTIAEVRGKAFPITKH